MFWPLSFINHDFIINHDFFPIIFFFPRRAILVFSHRKEFWVPDCLVSIYCTVLSFIMFFFRWGNQTRHSIPSMSSSWGSSFIFNPLPNDPTTSVRDRKSTDAILIVTALLELFKVFWHRLWNISEKVGNSKKMGQGSWQPWLKHTFGHSAKFILIIRTGKGIACLLFFL